MSPTLTPSAEIYLLDWGITLLIGGVVCLLLGCFIGWIIWKNTRKFTEKIEEGNRTALADYEKTSDEISKIKSGLSS
ncbi:MAG: hypothetical protein NWQ35_09050 [Verrucomicrobiales bacterium]|jgi:hypothetical protein|nr:hypothetical protein [Verrucomicrobiales bacterium]MDP5005989.1 hypothetical protein [Verrucomicrobiales bacterium]